MTDSTQRPTIVAVTGEDQRYAAVRDRAVQRARTRGGKLILYDVDAAGSVFESPLPTNWSADIEEPFGDRLGPDDLDAAGRGTVADQVRAARAAGVDTWAWLPERSDPTSLAGYAVKHGASLLVLPSGEANLGEDAPVGVEVVPGVD